MVLDHMDQYTSQWEEIRSIAAKIRRSAKSLPKWIERPAIDSRRRPGITSDECKRISDLERENFVLRRANEILRHASAYFAQAEFVRRAK